MSLRSKPAGRFIWTPSNVSSTKIPRMILRTRYEWQVLERILKDINFRSACDVGCGFGRMTSVLVDYTPVVYGIEREKELLEQARIIFPQVQFHNVSTLTKLPLEDKGVDLALTFTVLQHISDAEVILITREMVRISASYLLIVEETDPDHHMIDKRDKTHFTHGRSVEMYARLVEPEFRLVSSTPRRVEPEYKYLGALRETVGDFMLFEREPELTWAYNQ